ncbi:MAG: CaiA [Firmicutes bacterium]|nr:CaiA [Bacillota bacterium]
MDFNLTDEQQMLKQSARDFGKKHLEPLSLEIDHKSIFPASNIKKLAKMDFMGLFYPDEYGGLGMDFLSYILILEELSRYCASTAAVLAAHCSLAAYPIYKWGSEEQKTTYLPMLCLGEKLGGFALAEPGDAPAYAPDKVVATKDGETYRLNGKKYYVSNGGVADIYIVFAVTDPTAGMKGLSAFVVEGNTSGVTTDKYIEKMGLRGMPTTEMAFDNAKASLLGTLNQGSAMIQEILACAGVAFGAIATGICQTALEASIKYAKERVQFGGPIARLQAVQWMLADMAANTHLSRLAIYQTVNLFEEGKSFITEAAITRMFVAKASVDVCMQAVQVHGGYGYSKEMIIERLLRDVKGTMVSENSSEFPQAVIAGNLLR